MHIPRFVISGLSGGAGKTLLSLGLARAFARSGMKTRAFKKGPDYIDAAWLALAAKTPPANLDPFFTPGDQMLRLFLDGARGHDLALVEGNRGLFDGLDLAGTCSTAELARILNAPVILVVDCTKMTRTVAALVNGCVSFEENLHIGGVILNRTGNERHHGMVRKAVEQHCRVPVYGVLPRRAEPFMIERHMGLAGIDEFEHTDPLLDSLAEFVEEHVDIESIKALADAAPDLPAPAPDQTDGLSQNTPCIENFCRESSNLRRKPQYAPPCIGYVYDAAFWFYYRENLDALTRAGARLLRVSLLKDEVWPDIDGLYIGGGLPELHATRLSANTDIRRHVAGLALSGLPIYAECGGFMYLAKSLIVGQENFDMAGVFDLDVRFHSRPQGLGYVEATVAGENPYHPRGAYLRGHEFHFSAIEGLSYERGHINQNDYLMKLNRGRGMAEGSNGQRLDGLLRQKTFASYMHIYAPALPHWAEKFVALCGTEEKSFSRQ